MRYPKSVIGIAPAFAFALGWLSPPGAWIALAMLPTCSSSTSERRGVLVVGRGVHAREQPVLQQRAPSRNGAADGLRLLQQVSGSRILHRAVKPFCAFAAASAALATLSRSAAWQPQNSISRCVCTGACLEALAVLTALCFCCHGPLPHC